MAAPAGNSGNIGPIFRGTPDQAQKAMHKLLDLGYGKLSRAEVLGSGSSVQFAQRCLSEVDSLLAKYQSGESKLSPKTLEKILQKKSALEAKIKAVSDRDPKLAVEKLREKIFGSFFFSPARQLANRSIEELQVLLSLSTSQEQKVDIKKAFAKKGEQLAALDQKLATETDPSKLRTLFLKEGVHYDLLDYHFAALEMDVPENKNLHLEAIATITLKAKMLGIELIEPRTKGPEVKALLYAQADKLLNKESSLPIFLKSSLLNQIGDLLGPNEVRKLNDDYKIDIKDPETVNKFIVEVGLKGPESAGGLSKLVLNETRNPTAEGMEKARLALLIADKQEGGGSIKKHSPSWNTAAQGYIKRHLNDANQLFEYGQYEAAFDSSEKAMEIFRLTKGHIGVDENSDIDAARKNTFAAIKEFYQKPEIDYALKASTVVAKARDVAAKAERVADEEIEPHETSETVKALQSYLLEINGLKTDVAKKVETPALQAEKIVNESVERVKAAIERFENPGGQTIAPTLPPPPLPGAAPISGTLLPPPSPEDLEKIFSAPLPTTLQEAETFSLSSLSTVSSTGRQRAASEIVGPTIYDHQAPVPEPAPAKVQNAFEGKAFARLKGSAALNDPSRSMGDLVQLSRYASGADFAALNEAFKKRQTEANGLYESVKSLSLTDSAKIRKLVNSNPGAFKDALEMACYQAENSSIPLGSARLANLYLKAKMADIPIDSAMESRIESLKFTSIEGRSTRFIVALEVILGFIPSSKRKMLAPLAQAVPNWGSIEVRQLRESVWINTYGPIGGVNSLRDKILSGKENLFSDLFHFHVELAKDRKHPLADSNLNMIADLLIFMARTDGFVSVKPQDLEFLKENPKLINSLVDKLLERLDRLPEEENVPATVSALKILGHMV